jgi:Arc/MetJ-type ribon-helix-helix transcriptional regulator
VKEKSFFVNLLSIEPYICEWKHCQKPTFSTELLAQIISDFRTIEKRLDKVFFLGYFCSMKVKTSITLSEDLLKAIDKYTGEHKNRSEFIEDAVRAFIMQLIQRQQDARDLEIINQHADSLNREAADVLTYQVDL